MKKPNMLVKPLALAIMGIAAMQGGNAAAQANAAAEVEEIVVTGTRREGLSPTETLSPVDVIQGGSIQNQGAFDLTDSFTKLTPALNTQRFPIADGTAFVRPVTLRNLSPDHTLVLVNGTRRHRSALVNLQLEPLGTVNQGSQGVDFAAFPAGAIKRVEILRDGASAQYGSDAIAGIVNLILNDADEGFSISGQTGEYFDGDGERTTLSGNAGFGLGDSGFLNVSLEFSESDLTSRGNARPDAAYVASIVGADKVAYNGFGQRWGDPDIETVKAFVNSGFRLNENNEVYAHASYMDNETLSGFFYRGPVLDPSKEFTARSTLQTDANGDFLPDNASQALVNSIVAKSLNPADYLMASAGSPSGYVLRNPIYTKFPGGYSPLFGADIEDYAVVAGFRGENGNGLSWDVRGRAAENEVSYVLEDSINPSLGRLSPTVFNPGTLAQQESSINVDFVKTFTDSPLNVGFGFEFRNETYEISAGDAASIAVGPTYAQFGVGSDGFQGFPVESAGDFENDSYAFYLDVETDFTDRFSGAFALRYEDLDAFDTTLDWKLSGRYELSDALAVRATANTGFRSPTPGQVHTLNVTTAADSSGNLVPSGTYPVGHPIARALGAVPLDPEESGAYTLGLVWALTSNTDVTVDYYHIDIQERLGLQSIVVNAANVAALTSAGIPDANLLLGSNLNYFSNAFDSEVTGIDIALTTSYQLGGGNLDLDLRHNFNEQDVSDVKSGTISLDRQFNLEHQVPQHSTVLTLDYARGPFDGLVRINRYGDWETTGGLFGAGDLSDAETYGSSVLVDVEARYRFAEHFTLTLGGENIFDEYPDNEANGVLQFLGAKYALTSPYGFNGGFWYVRLSADF